MTSCTGDSHIRRKTFYVRRRNTPRAFPKTLFFPRKLAPAKVAHKGKCTNVPSRLPSIVRKIPLMLSIRISKNSRRYLITSIVTLLASLMRHSPLAGRYAYRRSPTPSRLRATLLRWSKTSSVLRLKSGISIMGESLKAWEWRNSLRRTGFWWRKAHLTLISRMVAPSASTGRLWTRPKPCASRHVCLTRSGSSRLHSRHGSTIGRPSGV